MATKVDDSGAAVCEHLQGASVASGESVGGGFIGGKEGVALALQAGEERKSSEAWYFDSGSSGNISNSCKKILIYDRATSSCVSLVARIFRLKVHGNLVVEFQSGHNYVRLKLIDGAFVSSSGPACVKQGHTYLGDHRGITTNLKSGESLLVHLVGNLYFTYGTRTDTGTEQACAVIAPGLLPTTDVDINAYHRSTAHTHHRLLPRSAEQQRVKLKQSKLLSCVGCSTAKCISASVNKVTECREDEKLRRRFVDLSGKKAVKSTGRQTVCHDLSG